MALPKKLKWLSHTQLSFGAVASFH